MFPSQPFDAMILTPPFFFSKYTQFLTEMYKIEFFSPQYTPNSWAAEIVMMNLAHLCFLPLSVDSYFK